MTKIELIFLPVLWQPVFVNPHRGTRVARAGSGEKYFQTIQGKELFITIHPAAKSVENAPYADLPRRVKLTTLLNKRLQSITTCIR